MKITDKCVGCGQCVTFCPGQVISVCGRAMIGAACSQCGVCLPYCPVEAIRGDEL